ncbi:hypothetical protein I4F81_009217 [Pyropia yezoensis]|uniref:Uncharacterized protein n=1 Tax=Pyropia yezoensis TaxID=2788 RepID=A0ACC3C8T3_PYRYE|nr:hypothetical protein I4F81_009217 [Neopyropia yezoensis]
MGAKEAGDSVSPTSLFDMVEGDGGNDSDTSGGSGRSSGSGRSTASGRSTGSIPSGRKSNIREEMLRLSAAAAVAVKQQMQQLQGEPRNRESAERSRLRRLAHLGKVQAALGAARSENTALRVQVALAHQRIRYLEYVVEAQGGVGVLPPQVLTSPLQRLWEGEGAAAAAVAAATPAEGAGGGRAGGAQAPVAAHGGGHLQ